MLRETIIPCGECMTHLIEADGGGRAVVFLHGMKFQARTWADLGTLEFLAGEGFRALALDLPGFGDSPACDVPPGEVLAALLRERGIVRPVLVGPSMGGRICLEFALDRPEVPGGLVLVGAVGVGENKTRLPGITVPTLVVWGSEDTVSSIDNAEILRDCISGASLIVIPDASHPCYLDNPDLWHAELLSFLRSAHEE